MSWDASLVDDCGDDIGCCEWNYTHNTNGMISAVLENAGYELESHWLIGHMGKSWFKVLNGLDGQKGAELLTLIIDGLEADPERFEAMNPANGWGSYDTLLPILKKMLAASIEHPTGKWSVRG